MLGQFLVPVCTAVTRSKSPNDLPEHIARIGEFLVSCRVPAVISMSFRFIRFLATDRSFCGHRGGDLTITQIDLDSQELRDSIKDMDPPIAELYRMSRNRPVTAVDFASIYRSLIHLFKCTLDWQSIENARRIGCRFDDTDLEVTRYLMSAGLGEVIYQLYGLVT